MAQPKQTKGRVNTSKLQLKPGAWLTNVGKSVGRSVFDVLQDVMPATAEIASNTSEYAMNFKEHMQELRAKRHQIRQAVDKNLYVDLGRQALRNGIEDFKAGNFYVSSSGDVDTDMDFGDWDVGDESDYDTSFTSKDGTTTVHTSAKKGNDVDVSNVSVHVDIGADNPMVSAINKQSQISTQLGEHAAELSKVNTTTIIRELSEFNEKSCGYLFSIDSNISTITTSVPTILSQHAALSAKYYEDSIGLFTTISNNLQEMRDSILKSNTIGGNVSYSDGKYEDVLDIFSSNGILNFKEYGKLVAKQFDVATNRNLIIASMKNVMQDTDSLKSILEHPLNLVTETVVKKILPETLRQSANQFDKMLQEATISGLYRIRGLGRSNNPILQILGETFGIGNKLKTDIDRSNYNKGKVDWNGESHKTLNEVIPYYLRKIAAGVTGTSEIIYDYQKGVFTDAESARKEYKTADENKLLGELKGVLSDFKEYIGRNDDGTGGLVFTEERQRKKVEDTFRNMLLKMVKQDGTTAYLKDGKFDNYVAEMLTGDGDNVDSQIVRLIASFMNTDRFRGEYGASALGSMQLRARNAFSRYKMREESGEEATLARYFNNGADVFDRHLIRDSDGKSTHKINYKVSPFIDRDKYGNSNTYYTRQILKLLATGVRVYGITDSGQGDNTIIAHSMNILNNLKDQTNRQIDEEQRERNRISGRTLSEDDILRARERGNTVIDLDSVTPEQLESVVSNLNDYDRVRHYREQNDENRSGRFISRILGLSEDSAMARFIARSQSPQNMLSDFFDKAEKTLFNLIYGSVEDNNSLFNRVLNSIQIKLRDGANWVNDHVFERLSTSLFGESGIMTKFRIFLFGKRGDDNEWVERGIFGKTWDSLFGDNGLVSKFKETQMYQDVKAQFTRFKKYMFGERSADGVYSGGLMSDTMTQLSSIGKDVKEALVGKNENSVLSNVKRLFGSLKDNTMSMFGYDKEAAARRREDPNYNPFRDAVDSIWLRMKTKTSELLDDVLGSDGSDGSPVSRRRQFADAFREEMKGKGGQLGAGAVIGGLGAAFLGGKVGFISSLFLPSGFIGGALLGLGVSVVKNSDQIKKFLFGEKNDEGDYNGGLVHKSVIDFFQTNKKGMVTGAFAGLASSMGFLPAWFMPGGPIGGALVGGAIQFAVNTDAFQTFLYGPLDENGERSGSGLFGKVRKLVTNDEGHLRAMDAAIGGGIGFLGSFFLPGGPILGSLLGAAASITLGSEQFRTFLFGEKQFDERGNSLGRKGGLLGKAYDKIVEPAMIKFRDSQIVLMGWLEQRIVSPFITSMKPILLTGKKIFKSFSNTVSGMFSNAKDYLVETVTEPMKSILTPFANAYKFIKKTTYRFAGAVISAPFKLLQAVGYALDIKHRIGSILKPIKETIIDPIADLVKTGIKRTFTLLFKAITAPVRLPLLIAKKLIGGVLSVSKIVGTFIGNKVGGPVKDFLDKRAERKRKRELNGEGFINRFKYKWRTLATNNGDDALNPERISAREENRRNVAESKAWVKYQREFNRFKRRNENSGLKMMTRAEFDKEHGHRSWWAPASLLGKSKSDESNRAENVNLESNSTTVRAANVTVITERGNTQGNRGRTDSGNTIGRMASRFTTFDDLDDESRTTISNAYEVHRRRAISRGETPMSIAEYARSLWNRSGGRFDRVGRTSSHSFNRRNHIESSRGGSSSIEDSRSRENSRGTLLSRVSESLQSATGATRVYVVGGHLEYIGRRVRGTMAEGGEVPETGLYALSRGERVIPNEPSRRHRDKRRENSLLSRIKNVFKHEEDKKVEDITYGTSINKTSGEESAELQNTQKAGSYLEKQKQEAENERTNRLSNLLQTIADNTKSSYSTAKEHLSSWLDTFDIKKGVLTLGFFALAPYLDKIVSGVTTVVTKIRDWLGPIITDVKEWFLGAIDDIKFGLDSVGGLSGVLSNLDKTASNILGSLGLKNDTGKKTAVNVDGTISLDKNGKPISLTKERKKDVKGRFVEFITPEKTQISLEQDTYGDAYYDNNYNSLSEAKLKLSGQVGARGVVLANRINRKVFNKQLNTKRNLRNAARPTKWGGTLDQRTVVDSMRKKDMFTSKNSINKNIKNNRKALTEILQQNGVDMNTDSTKRFIQNASLTYAEDGTHITSKEAKRISKQLSKKNGLKKYGLTAVADNVGDEVAGAVVGGVDNVTSGTTKIVGKGIGKKVTKRVAKETTEAVTTNTGFIKLCKEALDKVLELVANFLKKYKCKIGSKITGLINKVTNLIIKNPAVLSKFSSGISKVTAKAAAAASSFAITEVVGAGLSAISANPAAVFQVDKSAVDWKMQAIARIFKALLGTTLGSIIDIIDSIVMETTGTSFITELAILIYNLLSNDTDDIALKEARESFKVDYNKLVDREYNAYAENAAKEGKEVMDKETFKQNGLSTSFSDYISERNPTLGKKIWDGAKNIGSNIVGGVKKAGSTVAGAVKGAGSAIWDKTKDIGSGIAEAVTAIPDNITNAFTTATKGIKSLVSGFKNMSSDYSKLSAENMAIVNEKGISALFSRNYWSTGSNVDTNASGTFKSILTVANKFLTLPFTAVSGLFVSVRKGISSIINGFGNLTADLSVLSAENMAIVNEKGISALFDSSYWTDDSDVDTNASGTFKSILTVANKFLTLPFTAVSGLFVSVRKGISSIINGFTTLAVDVPKIHTENMAIVNEKGISALFDSSYWTDDSDVDTNASGTFKSILTKVTKFITLPVTAITGIFATTRNTISSIISNAKKVLSGINLNEASEVSLETSISDYIFIKDDGSDDGLGGINLITKMISRIMYLPIFVLRKIFSGFKNAVNGAKDFFSDIGDSIANLWKSITGGSGEAGGFGGFGEPGNQNGFPYYSQNDPKIRNKPYKVSQGDSTVAETMGMRGCGPTAMAMVASAVKGGYGSNPYSPEVMASMATRLNYSNNSGTTPAYFTNVGRQLGMNVTNVRPTEESIISLLYSGEPIILQGVSDGKFDSPYTSAGHYVVAVGTDNNGNILVNDPRGKEYSHPYTMEQVLRGSINAWGFSDSSKSGYGTIPNSKPFASVTFSGGRGPLGGFSKMSNKQSMIGGFGRGNWMAVVRAVKKAIADQNPVYSMTNSINITIDGKTRSVRTDCSGFVSACLSYYGAGNVNMNSTRFATSKNSTLTNAGFTHMNWTGWSDLREGDIIAINGHVEIYSHSENGQHKVYNCGSTSSIRSSQPTNTGHSKYTDVWRSSDVASNATTVIPTSVSTSSESGSSSVNTLSSILSNFASAIMTPIQQKLYGTTSGTSDVTTTANTSIDGATVHCSDNAGKAYNYFINKGMTRAGASGLLGNLYAESGINPINVQNSYEGKVGDDATYTAKVDKGQYTKFGTDSVGYGIAQWTSDGRKKKLYNHAKAMGTSIGDLDTQLGHLYTELSHSYPSVLKTLTTTNSIREASNKVLHKFEAPKDQSTAVEIKRARYGQEYYDKYAGGNGGFGDMNVGDIMSQLEYRKKNQSRISTRVYDKPTTTYGGYGNNIYQSIATRTNKLREMEVQRNISTDERVVKLLGDMLVEMQGTNGGISKLNEKEFSINSNHIDNSTTTNNTSINNTTSTSGKNVIQTTKQTQKKQNTSIDKDKYKIAKQIAKGVIM